MQQSSVPPMIAALSIVRCRCVLMLRAGRSRPLNEYRGVNIGSLSTKITQSLTTSLRRLSSSSRLSQAGEERKRDTPGSQSSWPRLRPTFLFGAGIYLGLVLFGKHREEKEESAFLAGLRLSFEDQDKDRGKVQDPVREG